MKLAARVWHSLRHHMLRNILLTILYTGLFIALISVILIDKAATDEIGMMTQTIGNQVIVEKKVDGSQGELQTFKRNELDTLIQSPYVASYNIVGMNPGNVLDTNPYIADEDWFNRVQETNVSLGLEESDNSFFLGVSNSEYYTLFTSAGFSLEQGEHITPDSDETSVLVSAKFAELNKLKIGDHFFVGTGNLDYNNSWEVEVVGIFNYPSKGYYDNELPNDNPANYIFFPIEYLWGKNGVYAPISVTVYLQDASLVKSYIKGMKETLGENIQDAVFGLGIYTYTWDKEWLATVIGPVLEVQSMALAMSAIIGVGVYIIILLISGLVMLAKRREIGIYLSLGETKLRLLIQTVLEIIVPIMVALLVAGAVSPWFAGNASEMIMEHPASDTNQQIEYQRELETIRQSGTYSLTSNIRSARSSYYHVEEQLSVESAGGFILISLVFSLLLIILTASVQVMYFFGKRPMILLLKGR